MPEAIQEAGHAAQRPFFDACMSPDALVTASKHDEDHDIKARPNQGGSPQG
jgi:hypothetical protein